MNAFSPLNGRVRRSDAADRLMPHRGNAVKCLQVAIILLTSSSAGRDRAGAIFVNACGVRVCRRRGWGDNQPELVEW